MNNLLCSPQFLSFSPKLFTHLCIALYEDAILVYRFGAQNMAAGKSRYLGILFICHTIIIIT